MRLLGLDGSRDVLPMMDKHPKRPARPERAIHLASSKIDVGYARLVFGIRSVKQFHSRLARRSNSYLESPVGKGIFDDRLNQRVVLDDQNDKQVFQASTPRPLRRCSIPDSVSATSPISFTPARLKESHEVIVGR